MRRFTKAEIATISIEDAQKMSTRELSRLVREIGDIAHKRAVRLRKAFGESSPSLRNWEASGGDIKIRDIKKSIPKGQESRQLHGKLVSQYKRAKEFVEEQKTSTVSGTRALVQSFDALAEKYKNWDVPKYSEMTTKQQDNYWKMVEYMRSLGFVGSDPKNSDMNPMILVFAGKTKRKIKGDLSNTTKNKLKSEGDKIYRVLQLSRTQSTSDFFNFDEEDS